ncbi:MAG: ATP-dependent helicase C-terminal domain-containing protein [Caulobacteraceae bacterium]
MAPAKFEAPTARASPSTTPPRVGRASTCGLQELYGLSVHPAVAGGKAPLTLALLSPAHRPIQLTKDLPGFWRGSWSEVRKEMRGRYPQARLAGRPGVGCADNPGQAARLGAGGRQCFFSTASAFLSIFASSAFDIRPAFTAWLARALALRGVRLVLYRIFALVRLGEFRLRNALAGRRCPVRPWFVPPAARNTPRGRSGFRQAVAA